MPSLVSLDECAFDPAITTHRGVVVVVDVDR
jgi:hypothetical protein